MHKITRMLIALVAVLAMATGTVWADGTPVSSRTEPQPPPGGYPATYRLMFVTEAGFEADQTDIEWYNTAVNNAANNLGGETGGILASLGATWKCIGSSSNVSARVNSKTLRPADAGYDPAWDVPIYNLAGEQMTPNNTKMWDGHLHANEFNGIWDMYAFETGEELNPLKAVGAGDPYNAVFTGTQNSGDIYAGQYLGSTNLVRANRGDRFWSGDWVQWGSIGPTVPRAQSQWQNTYPHLYGLSSPITAPAYTYYTLTFDPQGGTVNETSRQVTGLYGETYGTRKPLPTAKPPAGYIFGGWFENAAATGSALQNTTPLVISADKTIYAKLIAVPTGPGIAVTVLNHSFESPDLVNASTPNNPDSWTAYESNGGDTIIHEARTVMAGATDGDQIAYFDDRTPWGATGRGILYQTIGVGSDFAGYDALVLTFDARKGGLNGSEAGSGDNPENTFHAYFALNPTLVAGTLGRSDLNTQVGTDFYTTMGAGGVMRNISAIRGENPAATMDTFQALLDLSGVGAGDTVAIVFEYEFEDRLSPGSYPRVAVDNVRVEMVNLPTRGAVLIVK